MINSLVTLSSGFCSLSGYDILSENGSMRPQLRQQVQGVKKHLRHKIFLHRPAEGTLRLEGLSAAQEGQASMPAAMTQHLVLGI